MSKHRTSQRKRLSLGERSGGLLLHPTSLPGPHGCGDLGSAARYFADFVAAAGLRWWQMLPVGPPEPAGSPYSALSAFAGSPLLVSLDALVDDGLLTRREATPKAPLPDTRVSFAATTQHRMRCLRRAFESFVRASNRDQRPFDAFCVAERHWLDDFALFAALVLRHNGRSWASWPSELKTRRKTALAASRGMLADEIRFHCFIQYQFFRQWRSLKAYCNRLGVALLGDMPIFVGHQSADVWAHQDLFALRADGRSALQSGCSPDSFSRTGQLWQHPLYRWDRHAADGFAWWIARFRALLTSFDAVRIDHFLGFNRCWAIPGAARTAQHGRWIKSPGVELFDAVRRALGRTEIIAEDLGLLTPAAAALRDRCGFPGMRILQAAFGEGPGARYHQPHNYPRASVVYTGTHDNDTTLGWLRAATPDVRRRALQYAASDGREFGWDLIRVALASPANTAIIPMQDVLSLGSESRMNTPATVRGNWQWRMRSNELTDRRARRLRAMTSAYERS